MEVRTFERHPDAVPSTEQYDQAEGTDPTLPTVDVLRKAGYKLIAKDLSNLPRIDKAAELFEPMSAWQYRMYEYVLSNETVLEHSNQLPPLEQRRKVLAVLAKAQEDKTFDSIVELSSPETDEVLLVGIVQTNTRTQYCKIATWGTALTSDSTIQRLGKRFGRTGRRASKAMTVASFGLIWASYAYSWWFWLTIGLLILAGAVCWLGVYATDIHFTNANYKASPQERTLNWAIGLSFCLFIVTGIVEANVGSQPSTHEVLVCNFYQSTKTNVTPPEPGAWVIQTSEGDMKFDTARINGQWYGTGDGRGIPQLVGNWVSVTEHGTAAGTGHYVTEANTVRPGTGCG